MAKGRKGQMMIVTRWVMAAVVSVMLASPVAAQDNLFSARLYVGDKVITNYELQQRALFLTLLRAPGDPESQALDALIDDKLRLIEAEKFGLEVTPEALQAGLEEFASRANLTAEQFVEALAQGGVEAQTFRDFVEAGIIWRDIIRGKYGNTVSVTEAEVDRALAATAKETSIRLLLSELVLPVQPGAEAATLARAREIRAGVIAGGSFASAARQFSAAPSAGAGGALDWLELENLPPSLAPLLIGLAPGGVSEPVQVPGAVVVFQLRDLEETVGPAASGVQVEYAEYLIANTEGVQAEVARLRRTVDRCPELYAEAQGQPESQLTVKTQPMSQVPGDVGLELAKLDLNESSSAIVRGGNRVFLMLCGRVALPPEPEIVLDGAAPEADAEAEAAAAPEEPQGPNRDAVRNALLNQRLAGLADRDLAELRAEAIIREP
jgi:peptidyl-prolyl cis-trans isomerase SurA